MQCQLECDERWEEVTYFIYAMTIFILREILSMYFCLGLICLLREWPIEILKGVVLRLSFKQVGS